MSSLFLINTSYQVYTNVKAYENEYEDLMEHETLLNIANMLIGFLQVLYTLYFFGLAFIYMKMTKGGQVQVSKKS